MTSAEPPAAAMPPAEPPAAFPTAFPTAVPPQAGRPRRLIMLITVAWVVVLVVGIIWAVLRGEPTAREQTSIEQAIPVADRATAELATAATADGQAVVALSGWTRSDCSVTVIRSGVRYQRDVIAVVTPGTEQALMGRVAARLPASYGATVRRGSVPRLTADAGYWVRLSGAVIAPGQVRFVADTGACREEGNFAGGDQRDNFAGGDQRDNFAGGDQRDNFAGGDQRGRLEGDRAAAEAALTSLGVPVQVWSTYVADCPGATLLLTAEAVGVRGVAPGPLDARLREVAGSSAVVSTPELFAYRVGSTGVAVRTLDGRIVVTATTPCT